jgi:hypothetical protein
MDGFVEDERFFDVGTRLPLPVNQEILSHFGDHTLLDGDAVLALVLSHLCGGLDLEHVGQMLHVVDLFERLVSQLRRRNVTCSLVWFEDAEAVLWKEIRSLWLRDAF